MSNAAIVNAAKVMLASPLSVPKAIGIERWRVGVTRICSVIIQAEKSVIPHHNGQHCGQ